jgi:hypothetical protein
MDSTKVQHIVTAHPTERLKGFSGRYRRAGRLATITAVLLGFVAFFALISLIQAGTGLGLVDSARDKTLLPDAFADFDKSTMFAARLYFGAAAVTAVVFLPWLSRTVSNVPVLGGGTPSVTPLWAIGWWFIPIANLVKPYQIVRDLHDRMASPTSSAGGGWILMAWWICSVLGNAIFIGASQLPKSIDNPDSLNAFYGSQQVGNALSFLGAVLAIIVVLRIQWRSEGRAESLGIHRVAGRRLWLGQR